MAKKKKNKPVAVKAAPVEEKKESKPKDLYELTFLHADRNGNLTRFHISRGPVVLLFILIAVCFGTLIFMLIQQNMEFDQLTAQSNAMIDNLRTSLYDSREERDELVAELSEKDRTIEALSTSLTSTQGELISLQETETVDNSPKGYPLRGSATITRHETGEATAEETAQEEIAENEEAVPAEEGAVEGEDTQAEETGVTEPAPVETVVLQYWNEIPDQIGAGRLAVPVNHREESSRKDEPAVYFQTTMGSMIVAAADGTVGYVREISEEGNVVAVEIELDHGDGYFSYYYGAGLPLVSEGDKVNSGAVIMLFMSESAEFRYRIKYENRYIDPMEVMEVSG